MTKDEHSLANELIHDGNGEKAPVKSVRLQMTVAVLVVIGKSPSALTMSISLCMYTLTALSLVYMLKTPMVKQTQVVRR